MEILFILSLVAIGLLLVALSVGSILDDIRKVKRQRNNQLQPPARRRRTSPLVTILLETEGNATTTKDAVENILTGSYRRLEIIILCAPRKHKSLRQAIQLVRKNRRAVTVVTNRKSIREAYQRHGRGSIVATLRDTDRLDSEAIRHAVVHLNTRAVTAIRPDIVNSIDYSSLNLLGMYSDSLAYFWRKLMNIMTGTAVCEPRSFYRSDIFDAEHISPSVGHYYAADVVVHRLATGSHSSILHTVYEYLDKELGILWARSSMVWHQRAFAACVGLALVALPAILTYAIYLSTVAHQPLLLFVSLVLLAAYLVVGLWSRPGVPLRNKICLTVLAPMYMLPFYLATFVGAMSMLRILARTLTSNMTSVVAIGKKVFSR
jgi:hypothetical protein